MTRAGPVKIGPAVILALGVLIAPPTVGAQQPGKVYRIGFLTSTFDELGLSTRIPFFLEELGYREGGNVRFEKRSAAGADERLPDFAAELVRLKVDVIVTSGTLATRAAKRSTAAVPIVMAVEDDPVELGLVETLARPGGNVTGYATLGAALSGKRLELLKEAVPRMTRVGVMWNPANPDKALELNQIRATAQAMRLELESLEVRATRDIPAAFDAAVSRRCNAILVVSDSLFWSNRLILTDLATKHRLPAMYPSRIFVDIGRVHGLMSYEPGSIEMLRSVAGYVDRILKGAHPRGLPVEQPTRFDLVINLGAAQAIRLTIPQSVLVRADRVIDP